MSEHLIHKDQLPASFQLQEWAVDSLANRIRDKNSERKLEAKVMAVLVYMAQHKGQIVTREELEREIWGKTIVGYDALTSSIAKLRKSLNDNSRQPRFIETVSKKGYRLIAEVEISPIVAIEPTAPTPTQNRFWPRNPTLIYIAVFATSLLILALSVIDWRWPAHDDLAITVPDRPSIVVLPFENLSNEANPNFLSEGITRDVTISLSRLSGVFIIAGSSARAYKDRKLDAKQIATELGVRYIVEGSVQRSQSRLRISVALVDAQSGFQIWAESYDRDLGDLFAVQDDITSKLASALSVQLSDQEKRRIAHRYTHSIAAYDAFIQGQYVYTHHTEDDNQIARAFYTDAIKLDQNFARAYSAIALTYTDDYRFKWSASPEQALQDAKRMVNMAIEIDDQLPQAYWVSSLVHMHMREFEAGIVLANQAIELDPNYADSYAALAMSNIYYGEAETAIDNIRTAMRLNPHYPSHYASALGQAYYYLGRYKEALPVLRDAVQRNLNLQSSYVFLIATLVKLNQLEEADWMATQLLQLEPNFNANQIAKIFPLKDQRRVTDMIHQLRAAKL